MKRIFDCVLITGGGGYVGSMLVPHLLEKGYRVKVLDLFLFGEQVLEPVKDNPRLEIFKGDLRDEALLGRILPGCNAVIHLACISNDPSFELDPELGRSINFDAFEPLVRLSRDCGVKRFVYASSSSVYGVSDAPEVSEDHPLVPLTDYSKYKALCETVLQKYQTADFDTVIIRPATICGYSRRQRLDLTVNILTNHAVNKGSIKVFGGSQTRPNLHIQDMIELYQMTLELPSSAIAGKTYNVGYENNSVLALAEMVKNVVEREIPEKKDIELAITPTDDIRSYHICSEKIKNELDFAPRRTIEDAIVDLIRAFQAGDIPNPFDDIRYYNIKVLQEHKLR